ncbi:hypothetical protein EDD99_8076 [Streptomyces sp. 846.5]|nr:hypothetical protein EDD99_8076 [Streptomyces sp. 846.5]
MTNERWAPAPQHGGHPGYSGYAPEPDRFSRGSLDPWSPDEDSPGDPGWQDPPSEGGPGRHSAPPSSAAHFSAHVGVYHQAGYLTCYYPPPSEPGPVQEPSRRREMTPDRAGPQLVDRIVASVPSTSTPPWVDEKAQQDDSGPAGEEVYAGGVNFTEESLENLQAVLAWESGGGPPCDAPDAAFSAEVLRRSSLGESVVLQLASRTPETVVADILRRRHALEQAASEFSLENWAVTSGVTPADLMQTGFSYLDQRFYRQAEVCFQAALNAGHHDASAALAYLQRHVSIHEACSSQPLPAPPASPRPGHRRKPEEG